MVHFRHTTLLVPCTPSHSNGVGNLLLQEALRIVVFAIHECVTLTVMTI